MPLQPAHLLPPVLAEIASLIGESATLALMRDFGGQAIRIPATERSALWPALVESIGLDAVQVLARCLGNQDRYITRNDAAVREARNAAMGQRYDELLKNGHSTRGATAILVKETGLTDRQIQNILNRPADVSAARQVSLF